MVKIYSSGNDVIVDDGDNLYEYAKGHTLYVLVDDIFYIKEITQGQYKVSVADLEAGNITSEDSGDVYTVATFTTFLRENTGFKTAPGGSGATPVGATLMKTGQTTSYNQGDDGDTERGRASSFLVLPSNNPFGNTNRFTSKVGTQVYTDSVVIDWSTYNGSTVLAYYHGDQNTRAWATQCIQHLTSTFNGLTGWNLVNFTEMTNIMNFNLMVNYQLNYTPFNTTRRYFWVSTQPIGTIGLATDLAGVNPFVATSKTNSVSGIWVRVCNVSGTTLT